MTSPSVAPEQDLRYPIGRSDMRSPLTAGERAQRIDAIAVTPSQLRHAVTGLSDEQLDTPYRPGGWAELADMRLPIETSLRLLDGLHERWVHMLQSLPSASFERQIFHPENGPMT